MSEGVCTRRSVTRVLRCNSSALSLDMMMLLEMVCNKWRTIEKSRALATALRVVSCPGPFLDILLQFFGDLNVNFSIVPPEISLPNTWIL